MSQTIKHNQERLSQDELGALETMRDMARSEKVKKLSTKIWDNIDWSVNYKRVDVIQALQNLEEIMIKTT